MSVGWWEYKVQRSFISKIYTLLFGIGDFHTHIRFRAVKNLFQQKDRNVEIGAGSGVMSIGFYYSTKDQ